MGTCGHPRREREPFALVGACAGQPMVRGRPEIGSGSVWVRGSSPLTCRPRQTAPRWSRSFVQWGAPPCPLWRSPARENTRDGKPYPNCLPAF
jgi:hypothetical protein